MRDRVKRNEYQRKYQLSRYHKRRQQALERLGNKCSQCGSVQNLEIDHKNAATKSFAVSKLWSIAEEKFWKEIEKCQLLCKEHHIIKSIYDIGNIPAKGTHGTVSSYRYCKCRLCKDAYNEMTSKNKKKYRTLPS